MGAQTRTDVLPYISLIPVFGYLWPGTSIKLDVLITIHIAKYSVSWDLADAKVFVLNKRGHRLV